MTDWPMVGVAMWFLLLGCLAEWRRRVWMARAKASELEEAYLRGRCTAMERELLELKGAEPE